MTDLVEAATSVEGRLVHAERTLTDVRVAVARVEIGLKNHETSVAEFRSENATQYQSVSQQIGGLAKQLEPLKEARWKASGAYSMLAAVVSAGISLAIKFLWK